MLNLFSASQNKCEVFLLATDEKEAEDLANVLQSGKLPLSINTTEQKFTGITPEKETQTLSILILAFFLALTVAIIFTTFNAYKLLKSLRA